MGVIIGEDEATSLSYLEYQLLMLFLAGSMCFGLLVIELTLKRFQVLPLLFPGMFSIRERRFYFFDFDVSDREVGNKLRSHVKMLARITLLVCLAYLWQHCVMETTQLVGKAFPESQCDSGSDCFASDLTFVTLINRKHLAVPCQGPRTSFEQRVVLSCIRFVPPSATNWLMHLAIAQSVMQMNLKSYEFLVWFTGSALWSLRIAGIAMVLGILAFIASFASGVISEFVSSWLSVVMFISIPVFFHTVWQTAKILDTLRREEAARVQHSIEEHYNEALASFDAEKHDQALPQVSDHPPQTPGSNRSFANTARSLLRFSHHFPSILQSRASKSIRSAEEDLLQPASRAAAEALCPELPPPEVLGTQE